MTLRSTNNTIEWKMQPLSCLIHSQYCLVVSSDQCTASDTSDERLSVTGFDKKEPHSVILLSSENVAYTCNKFGFCPPYLLTIIFFTIP